MGVSARVVVALTAVVYALVVGLLSPAAGGVAAAPQPLTPPVITGEPTTPHTLRLTRATWATPPTSVTLQWLRDGVAVPGATAASYRLRRADLGHTITVSETGWDATGPTTIVSAAVGPIERGRLEIAREPRIAGTARYGEVVRAVRGRTAPGATRTRVRWERDGELVGRGDRYRIGVADVGAKLRIAVTYKRDGFEKRVVTSQAVRGEHRVGVRRRFTYSVATRGPVTASLKEFRSQAQQTYDDPRGWRAAGFEFRPVKRGGDFTLVLSTAAMVPSFSSVCSSTWSCRVGRYVIINQTRWLHASPAWNAAGRSRRDYRHMVVNHETGHWLGHGHAYCSGSGPAPVMMQQSKGRGGCSFNPWPLPWERWTSR